MEIKVSMKEINLSNPPAKKNLNDNLKELTATNPREARAASKMVYLTMPASTAQ